MEYIGGPMGTKGCCPTCLAMLYAGYSTRTDMSPYLGRCSRPSRACAIPNWVPTASSWAISASMWGWSTPAQSVELVGRGPVLHDVSVDVVHTALVEPLLGLLQVEHLGYSTKGTAMGPLFHSWTSRSASIMTQLPRRVPCISLTCAANRANGTCASVAQGEWEQP